MSIESTSALTLRDLVLEIARKLGVAYYGDGGDEPAQAPIDAHDLAECKRHANNAIRMFIADAPPAGWRWVRTVGAVTLWPDIAINAAETVVGGAYDSTDDQTLLTASSGVFYETMEELPITVTNQGILIIKRYVSATKVYVYGNHPFASSETYSIESGGNFTLPRSFAGNFTGQITFGPATNQAVRLLWVDESTIRENRENATVYTGTPRQAAIDIFVTESGRKRYRLMLYPAPYQIFVVQFPYDIHFDLLDAMDETPPTPIIHDEAIKAACLAVAEVDEDEAPGIKVDYYINRALPNSRNLDARSGPRRLGYFGNARVSVTPRNFREYTQRTDVGFNG